MRGNFSLVEDFLYIVLLNLGHHNIVLLICLLLLTNSHIKGKSFL